MSSPDLGPQFSRGEINYKLRIALGNTSESAPDKVFIDRLIETYLENLHEVASGSNELQDFAEALAQFFILAAQDIDAATIALISGIASQAALEQRGKIGKAREVENHKWYKEIDANKFQNEFTAVTRPAGGKVAQPNIIANLIKNLVSSSLLIVVPDCNRAEPISCHQKYTIPKIIGSFITTYARKDFSEVSKEFYELCRDTKKGGGIGLKTIEYYFEALANYHLPI